MTAGIGVAAMVGGLTLVASPANAATSSQPTLTVMAPPTAANNGPATGGQPQQPLTVDVNNTGSGNDDVPPDTNDNPTTAQLVFNLTVPSGIPCASVRLVSDATAGNADHAGPDATLVATSNSPACTYQTAVYTNDEPLVPKNSNYVFGYDLVVGPVTVGAAGTTGTLTSKVSLTETINDNTSVVASSNTASTTVEAPQAPSFNSAPPAATIYEPYAYQLVKSPGAPPTPQSGNTAPEQEGYRAFGAPTVPTGDNNTYTAGVIRYPDTTVPGTKDLQGNEDSGIYLGNYDADGNQVGPQFYFDTETGKIVAARSQVKQAGTLAHSWTIIANNGQGGATKADTGNPPGNAAPPTPNTYVHDVDAPIFTLNVQYKDLPTTGKFAEAVYTLSGQGIVSGYADGTFKGARKVSRQAFAHYAIGVEAAIGDTSLPASGATGTCGADNPSAFPDVKNGSQFCAEIRELHTEGVIQGYADGGFHPAEQISRQAMAAFVFRVYEYEVTGTLPKPNPDLNCSGNSRKFNDVPAKNPFCGDIEFLAKRGVIKGYSDGGFHPVAPSSRQAAVSFLFEFENSYLYGGLPPSPKAIDEAR
jgi:hypothetical protein